MSTPKLGDTVQVQEWIGVVVSIDDDGLYEVEWDSWGGPFGSARTTCLPASWLHVRRDVASEGAAPP